ncbi:MAG: hypothetical protein QF440_06170, partial [Candidatus Thalassarchaeaceae archaeon]|nr:hypothetical protein [Candidatus Thalassarchaeaceae archaeon]
MAVRFRPAVATFILLLISTYLPLAAASGSGLLMSDSSLLIEGDGDVGQGDVNISVDVTAHNSNSIGFIEMTLSNSSGVLLASENHSVSLSSGQSGIEWFNISSVPIGVHTLTLQLTGDVGQDFGSNVSFIQVYIHRLSPAAISMEDSDNWDLIAVNADTAEASLNTTLRDGDYAWLLIELDNSGDVNWTGNLSLNSQNLSVIVEGGSSKLVNFTAGPFTEGEREIVVGLFENQNLIQSDNVWVSIGPPPLPRPILSLSSSSNGNLGEEVYWNATIYNSGELNWSGWLDCSFPSGIKVFNQSVLVEDGQSSNF